MIRKRTSRGLKDSNPMKQNLLSRKTSEDILEEQEFGGQNHVETDVR